ncbi:MAG: SOS response-associated peptidase, partial [Actinomycetota bacterium]
MCGRFVATADPERIAAYFGATPAAEGLGENYNVAPTQDVLAVVERPDGDRRVEAFHWGLIPSWAKDKKIASRMINARAETLGEKPAFRGLFAKKRCIIPMDGFYEWQPGAPGGPVDAKGKPRKQPMFIHRNDDELLAVAGLWSAWKDPEDPEQRWLHSLTIVTTAANDTMRPVHDRMPVLLEPDQWARWLDPELRDTAQLVDLFDLSADRSLTMHSVSTEVNNVRNNRAELIEPGSIDDA